MLAEWRRRPWPIHLYAFITLAIGVFGYVSALRDLSAWELAFEDMAPYFAWNSDMAIVALSARLTIVCIPVAAIWVWGARLARTLVTIFTVFLLMGFIRLMGEGTAEIDPIDAATTLALGCAWALLFTPSASRWLQPKKEKPVAEMFE